MGLGGTDPAQTVGVPAAGAGAVTLPVSVTIGGVSLTTQDILYAGVSPSFIGLYQVKSILTAHGADIDGVSREGHGTTVRARFPVPERKD